VLSVFLGSPHIALQTQAIESEEYSIETAKVIAQSILTMNYQLSHTYSLFKGIKEFGNKGLQAAHEEIKQLHDCIVFKLYLVEQRCAIESLIFLTKKKNGRNKVRTCANGSTQCEYTKCNEAASPMEMTESHLITAVIDAKQGCNLMTANIPNAFVQMDIEKKPSGKKSS
jgi:hypothetical protein